MTAPAKPPSPPDGLGAPSPRAQRLMRLSAVGGAVLVLAGGVAFYAASQVAASRGAADADAVTVTLRNGACEPMALEVPAGRSIFRIVNETDRATEWEILDGVMVMEERENIAPGITQTLSARLSPGRYAITCGLLSNPRGSLTVTAAAMPDGAAAARPALTAFIGPLAEYQVFVGTEANRLVKASAALDAAVRSGDLDAARTAYAAARLPFMRLRPAAARQGDLDAAMNAQAAYLEKREADPAFTGFHRLEYGLFAKNSLDGLAPVSAKLAADAAALKERLRADRPTPQDMGENAERRLAALADTTIPAGEDAYAASDLADIEAELSGVAKIARLFVPIAEDSAPAAAGQVEARLTELDAALEALRGANGYPSYATVDAPAREALAARARALRDSLSVMNAALGIGEGDLT